VVSHIARVVCCFCLVCVVRCLISRASLVSCICLVSLPCAGDRRLADVVTDDTTLYCTIEQHQRHPTVAVTPAAYLTPPASVDRKRAASPSSHAEDGSSCGVQSGLAPHSIESVSVLLQASLIARRQHATAGGFSRIASDGASAAEADAEAEEGADANADAECVDVEPAAVAVAAEAHCAGAAATGDGAASDADCAKKSTGRRNKVGWAGVDALALQGPWSEGQVAKARRVSRHCFARGMSTIDRVIPGHRQGKPPRAARWHDTKRGVYTVAELQTQGDASHIRVVLVSEETFNDAASADTAWDAVVARCGVEPLSGADALEVMRTEIVEGNFGCLWRAPRVALTDESSRADGSGDVVDAPASAECHERLEPPEERSPLEELREPTLSNAVAGMVRCNSPLKLAWRPSQW
jgi:hypothetical protein